MIVPAVDFVRIWRYVLDEMPSRRPGPDDLGHGRGAGHRAGRVQPGLRPALAGRARARRARAVAKQGWMCCFSGKTYLHSSGAVGADDRYLVVAADQGTARAGLGLRRGPGLDADRDCGGAGRSTDRRCGVPTSTAWVAIGARCCCAGCSPVRGIRLRPVAIAVDAGPRSPLTPAREGPLRHAVRLPPRSGRYVAWPEWVPPPVRQAFGGPRGGRAVEPPGRGGRAGPRRHATWWWPPAPRPGKSLAYQLPVLAAVRRGPRGPPRSTCRRPRRWPPTSCARWRRWGCPTSGRPRWTATPRLEARDWARRHGRWLFSNPDMLHRSVLPRHGRWAAFLRRLRYVVIDECHTYRGVFGSHVALLLRRLLRICARYGARPTIVLASATVAEPGRVRRPG